MIRNYAVVTFEDSFFIFGGKIEEIPETRTKTVAVFSTITKKWTKVGDLKIARLDHGVFVQQVEFVVVGGAPEEYATGVATERCHLNGEEVQCEAVSPELLLYSIPAMMRVPHNYCPLY